MSSSYPKYLNDAGRESIVAHVLDHLRTQFTSLGGEVPKQTLTRRALSPQDAVVPEELIHEVILELEDEGSRLDSELSKYDFVRVEGEGQHGFLQGNTEKSDTGKESSRKKGGKKGRQKGRSSSRR